METLYKLPLITNSGDIKNMREFHNIIEMNFRNLEAIQVEPESYGSLLILIIQDKLPNELIIQLSRIFDATVDIWSIQDIMKDLKLRIKARERVVESRRSKVNRTSFETIEGLVATDKIVCP